jgi:hypothetical protein
MSQVRCSSKLLRESITEKFERRRAKVWPLRMKQVGKEAEGAERIMLKRFDLNRAHVNSMGEFRFLLLVQEIRMQTPMWENKSGTHLSSERGYHRFGIQPLQTADRLIGRLAPARLVSIFTPSARRKAARKPPDIRFAGMGWQNDEQVSRSNV